MGAVISNIICLIKIDTDRQTDENGRPIFHTLGVMKRLEILKVASCPMDSITTA